MLSAKFLPFDHGKAASWSRTRFQRQLFEQEPRKIAYTCPRCRKPVGNSREHWGWACEDCADPNRQMVAWGRSSSALDALLRRCGRGRQARFAILRLVRMIGPMEIRAMWFEGT